MLVIRDLTAVRSAAMAYRDLAKLENPEPDWSRWITVSLLHRRPRLSSLFEANMARLLRIDVKLAAHLSLFATLYLELDIDLQRIDRQLNPEGIAPTGGRSAAAFDILRTSAGRLASQFEKVVQHAECAEHLLAILVVPRPHPWIAAIRTRLFGGNTKECDDLLDNG